MRSNYHHTLYSLGVAALAGLSLASCGPKSPPVGAVRSKEAQKDIPRHTFPSLDGAPVNVAEANHETALLNTCYDMEVYTHTEKGSAKAILFEFQRAPLGGEPDTDSWKIKNLVDEKDRQVYRVEFLNGDSVVHAVRLEYMVLPIDTEMVRDSKDTSSRTAQIADAGTLALRSMVREVKDGKAVEEVTYPVAGEGDSLGFNYASGYFYSVPFAFGSRLAAK